MNSIEPVFKNSTYDEETGLLAAAADEQHLDDEALMHRIALLRFRSTKPTIRALWMVYFVVGFLVVCSGILSNGGGRKYIPVDPAGLSSSCSKAYVNVHASSADEKGAIVCCDGTQDEWSWIAGTYESALCAPRPRFLRFDLTKFPDAWLLPLVPILLRFVVVYFVELTQIGPSTSSSSGSARPHHQKKRTTIRRLIFYILVMNFRGWGLYIFANRVEDAIVAPEENLVEGGDSSSTWSSEEEDTCWYQHLLPPHRQHSHWYGRTFDFSDHVVLFFAHILPIVVFEMLFCFLFPFWKSNGSTSSSSRSMVSKPTDPIKSMLKGRKRSILSSLVPRAVLPLCLSLGFIYLILATFLAVHKTAAYFHTGKEIVVGYVLSLLVQLPLGYMMCSERWGKVRHFFGLPSGELHEH